MGILADLLGGVASDLYDEIPSEITDLYTTPLTQITAPDITFQPFTVTSGMGSVTGGPTGTQYSLGGTQQAIQDQLMSNALSRFRQGVTGVPASEAAGIAAMGSGRRLLDQQTFGVPSTETAALQAFGAGSQFLGAAGQQPADINLLRGQFAGQVGGLLDQQPSPAIGQFGQQALSMGQAGLGAQAPADVEALRQQYGGLAGQAAMDVLTPTAAREAGVYERIRATQRPEEERQRLALEERLAQQGRLGVRTAMFGGTPEQFAMAKAQEEAQDRASLAAMQQAQSERQQALGTAQTLGGMFGQQAGLSSQLQSAAQQRASQLSQLGLSAQQVESQLQSEGLGRAATAAGQAGQMAQLAGGLQAQQAGLGSQFLGLGSQLSSQRQAMDAARQSQALQALTTGQGLLSGGLGLEGAQQQLGISGLQAGYAPQAALLSSLSPAINIAGMADVARRQQGEYDLEAALANLSGQVGQQSALGSLYGSMFSGAGGLLGSLTGAGGSIAEELIKKLPFSDIRLKDNITKVGELDSGINLYTWEWNEEGKRLAGDTPTFGVLAQEVQEVTPEAVTRGNHGYLMVNYAKLI